MKTLGQWPAVTAWGLPQHSQAWSFWHAHAFVFMSELEGSSSPIGACWSPPQVWVGGRVQTGLKGAEVLFRKHTGWEDHCKESWRHGYDQATCNPIQLGWIHVPLESREGKDFVPSGHSHICMWSDSWQVWCFTGVNLPVKRTSQGFWGTRVKADFPYMLKR